ncbi:YbaB/EbfC family nucleoid-associated protein [Streptomyces sp. NPDC051636]|uniref:YbaB/EbfC family nucleoid-associated protein n=1 Tax=Streptomyces sp. NPDC051636 TaxID=3365663 RepID=UPI0037A38D2E
MDGSLEDRVAQAMAHLKATEEAVAKVEGELSQASETARSADRSVQVTVGAKGELAGLEFLGGMYKNMTAAQLSAAVLEATNKARAEMARRVVGMLDPIARKVPGGGMSERRNVDWDKIFGSMLSDPSDAPKPTAMSRLRDEIHDDDEESGTASAEHGAVARKRAGA